MSLYDVDFQKTGNNLLPVDKRTPVHRAWVAALTRPLQRAAALFGLYRTGAPGIAYAAGTTYSIGDVVSYGGVVYESLQATNAGNTPASTSLWWGVAVADVSGMDERITYNSQKIVLEWALNKKFGTIFRQPPLVSDIYVSAYAAINASFLIGQIEQQCGVVYLSYSQGNIFNALYLAPQYAFAIYVPLAVYNGLSQPDKTIRAFADKYVVKGITYTILTY